MRILVVLVCLATLGCAEDLRYKVTYGLKDVLSHCVDREGIPEIVSHESHVVLSCTWSLK